MVNKEDFAKRLIELMDHYELSASSLADKLNVQRSSISHLLSGRNNPSLDFVSKVIDNYSDVSFKWLVKGIGSLETLSHDVDDEHVSPTLFDQSSISSVNKDVPISTPTRSYSKKTLIKTLLLYSDGSFEVYDDDSTSKG